MSGEPPVVIERWNQASPNVEVDLNELGQVLHACVHAGASVSFVLPFSHADAVAFWRAQILPGVREGSRIVVLARLGVHIVGTVQLDLATPPNQPHRAEVKKLLVHPWARRRGIGKSLMTTLENHARAAHRSVLTLDTVTGGAAESLYLSIGFVAIGSIPRYALNFDSSKLESTTVMYKILAGVPAGVRNPPALDAK